LSIEYNPQTDKSTPVILSNHSYFNQAGFDTPEINDHILQINATYYTENNEYSLPTGIIRKTAGTPLDFVEPKKIGNDINSFPVDKGYNHNFILESRESRAMIVAAHLSDPGSGRTLNVYTDQPAIQLYTPNSWDGSVLGSQGKYYQMHGAVALETQAYPDSPNQPSFPNTSLDPGKHYFSTTIYEFGVQ
ncbi:MAG: galactose mutarotase, partial [Ginsengibacter sp.]